MHLHDTGDDLPLYRKFGFVAAERQMEKDLE